MSRVLARLLARYARGQAAAAAGFIVGTRVLDLGTGEAYVPAALAARPGLWACGVDIGVYRRAHVPYVVYDGGRLPFRDATFDTTLLLLTLHHCDAPEAVLEEAIRVTRRRLVVTESVYRTAVERFWLDLLDGRVNRFRHEGTMRPALHVRRPEEWERLFGMRALSIVATRWLGSAVERLVHHPVLWALDVAPARIDLAQPEERQRHGGVQVGAGAPATRRVDQDDRRRPHREAHQPAADEGIAGAERGVGMEEEDLALRRARHQQARPRRRQFTAT